MPRSVWWGLIGVIAFSLALGFSASLASTFRSAINRIKDQRAARTYFPLLRKQVHRFGDFVTSSRPDTLHWIADSLLCEGHGERIARLGMPNVAAWSGRWDLFCRRLDRQKPNPTELQYAILEFHDLVGTYTNLCAATVFERLPQDMMAAMTPRAKSNLSAFQQRFESFRSDSEHLLKDICESRPSLGRLPYSLAPIRPLP